MIIIDTTYASDNIAKRKLSSGTAVFLIEILSYINKTQHSDKFILLCTKQEEFVLNDLFPNIKTTSVFQFSERFFARVFNKINRKIKQAFTNNMEASQLWFPFSTPYFFYESIHYTISTIHDLIPVHENTKNLSLKNQYHKVCNISNEVVAISHYVKNDIVKTLSIDENKIHVIYNPVTVNLDSIELVDSLKEKKFILDLNAYQKRKNADTLIRAYKKVSSNIDADLVFCGGYDEDNTLQHLKVLSEKLEIADRVHFYLSLPLSQRNWLLTNAKFLVSPSLSEGFGRTPIEAAIVKKKVIVTKVDSLHEVTLGLLHYIENPLSADEISRLLLKVDYESNIDSNIEYISKKFIERYNPERIVNEYFQILKVGL